MIPKRVHYIWVGSPLPDRHRRRIDDWRAHNPGFEFVQWDESTIDFSAPRLQQAYARRQWAKVADITRLMAISRHGGFYFDVDFHLYRPLDPLLRHRCVLSFQTEQPGTDWVSNGMMAAVPGHWFIKRALERVLSLRPVPFGFDRPTRYGPKLITRLLIEEGLVRYEPAGVQVKDIHVCPTSAFFPWPYGEPFRDGFIKPETYGMHVWEKSWEQDVPVLIRTGKAALRQSRRLRRAFGRA